MNKQQTFNKVVRHLAVMTARSYNYSEGNCAYRSPDGDKCAVGCLIPDELYSPRMEGSSASAPHMGKLLGLLQLDVELLRQLQLYVHDRAENWGPEGLNQLGWFALECLASEHGLRMPELETVV